MKRPEGLELVEEIKKLILSLDSINEIKFDDPVEYAIEGKGRTRAVEIITLELLSPLMSFIGEKEQFPPDNEAEDAGIKIKE